MTRRSIRIASLTLVAGVALAISFGAQAKGTLRVTMNASLNQLYPAKATIGEEYL